MFRATNDIDLVAALDQHHVFPLCKEVEKSFFADDMAIELAIRNEKSFNLIHKTTIFKVDVFVRRSDEWSAEQLRRAGAVSIPSISVPVKTASVEDVILAKLRWYRMGNEVSERQWRDVLGVIEINRATLDRSYLESTAEKLGLSTLLKRAMEQAKAELI